MTSHTECVTQHILCMKPIHVIFVSLSFITVGSCMTSRRVLLCFQVKVSIILLMHGKVSPKVDPTKIGILSKRNIYHWKAVAYCLFIASKSCTHAYPFEI